MSVFRSIGTPARRSLDPFLILDQFSTDDPDDYIAGFIGGLLGLGGGFIIGPMLMEMGYSTKQAAATTAFIVTFSSFSGFLGHMAEGHINPLLKATSR